MGDQLEVKADLTNNRVQFSGTARENPAVKCDYTPPLGDGQGYTSLELLLMSLAVCSGTSVVALLRRMQKDVSDFTVTAKGTRRDQHPTSFETIFLNFIVSSKDARDADVQKAITLSEESICPVWCMLKGNVKVIAEYKITQ